MAVFSDPMFWQDLFIAAIRMAIPILFVALGELYSEHTGMINIGLEGIMTIGAFACFVGSYLFEDPVKGLLFGMCAGLLFNLLFAFVTVTLKANHILTGIVMNIFAAAFVLFANRLFYEATSASRIKMLESYTVPVLSEIPIIGKILFIQNPLFYIVIICVVVSHIYLKKTKSGLNYRAVGENPRAAETLGIKVERIKYIGCMVCGILAGLGGAYLTACYIGSYSDNMVAGRGYIGFACVMFGNWSTKGVAIATLIYGFFAGLSIRLQVTAPGIPYQFLSMLPYLVTIFVIVFSVKNSRMPKASGKLFYREER